MSTVYVVYNPLAGNMTGRENSNSLGKAFEGSEVKYIDAVEMGDDFSDFISKLDIDDKVVLSGGDGTINWLANAIDADNLNCELYYYAAGSGNDFYNDIKDYEKDKIIELKKYLRDLPIVEVNGITKRFVNGIGYGIDGYCCEEGDIIRQKKPGKPVNYTLIALKGLVYGYKCANATVTVDGITKTYNNVWMVPAMNGRFYGGGMMCAPNQNRLKRDNKVSVIVVHSESRIKLITAFLSVFKGEHLKYTNLVEEIKGSNVHVRFDRPTALQIDGDTVRNVTEYSVRMK